MGDVDWLPDVHWGHVGAVAAGLPYDGLDPDDEMLDVTPPEVVMVLGFDPRELLEA